MAKFRIMEKDIKKLKNMNRAIKSNITRNKKMKVDLDFTIRDISSFKTRKEFNKYLKSGEKFRKENRYIQNELGKTFNRNLIEQANKEINKINKERRKKKRQLGKIQATRDGEKLNMTVIDAREKVQDMRFGVYNDLKKININSFRTTKQLEKRLTALKKESKDKDLKSKTLQSNYIKSLKNQFESGTLSKKEYLKFKKDIKRLSPNQFEKWFLQEEKSVSNFNYIIEESLIAKQLKKDISSDLTGAMISISKFIKNEK